MSNLFGAMAGLVYISYLIMGLVQVFAIVAGIQAWLGLYWIIALILAFFVTYIPLLGPILGVAGAVEVWGWSYGGAILLFFWPYVLMLFAMIASSFSRNRT